jgi:lipoprotein-releasing system permease protein
MSFLGFERQVALRFLIEGRKQTLLIIIGVAAGVAVVTYISALITGLQRNTLDKTLGTQAHVTISALEDTVRSAMGVGQATRLTETQPRAQRLRSVDNWQSLLPILESLPQVKAVSPVVLGAGLALRGEASRAISLTGVDLNRYDKIVGLRGKVVAGVARLQPGEAIIGRDLAADLGVRVGDRLSVVTNPSGGSITESVRVTALVDFGLRELNRRSVIVPLGAAQSLVGLPGGVTHLDMKLHDVWAASALATDLSERYDHKIESWQTTNASLVSALNAQSVSTTLIRAVVMVVVVLGISSVLVVSVVQKRREIGILRAMGTTRGQVLRVFLLQGAIVGALGSTLGIILALGLITAFTTFVRGSDGLPLFAITLAPLLALKVALIMTVSGVLAAVMPARTAAALDPAQAIRM